MVSNASPPPEEVQILTLDQFGLAEDGPDDEQYEQPSVKSVQTPSDAQPDNNPVKQPEHDLENGTDLFHTVPAPASMRRIYLMVMADFGLAFTWLCKFAVAT